MIGGYLTMWNRKELKARGKAAFWKNKWAAIAVCFILAFTGAEFADSVSFIRDFDPNNVSTDVTVIEQKTVVSNWDTTLKWLRIDVSDGTHPMWAIADQSVRPYFDALTAPASAMFALLDRSGAQGFGAIALAVAGLMGGIWFLFWVSSALLVGARRFFLENRSADAISIAAMFTPFHRGNWWPTVKAMLTQSILQLLWTLTIAGGFIKFYSYRMTPYILAENPKATPLEAVTLSRRMMHGSKWRCFLLDATFILQWVALPTLVASPLAIIAGLSLGHTALFVSLTGVATCALALLFVNGYRAATYTELYLALREQAIAREEPLAALFTVPQFGGAVMGEAADAAVFHVKHQRKKFDYNRRYSIKTLILLFFSFAFIGWLWEVSLHVVTQGVLINRGTMLGPWLPIYGAGGALVLLLLKKLFKNPVATFFVSMLLCSVIEYGTSWYLEVTKGVRWWDYSGYFMNLNGRICLEGAVVFGLGCCAVVYFAGPALGGLIDRLTSPVQLVLCAVLVALFSTDAVYSHFHPNTGKGITDYNDWQTGDAPAAGFIAHIAPRPVSPTRTTRPH